MQEMKVTSPGKAKISYWYRAFDICSRSVVGYDVSKIDKFIAENWRSSVTGGWTDDKVSELEKQLGIAF